MVEGSNILFSEGEPDMRAWNFALVCLVIGFGSLSAQVEFKAFASSAGRYKVDFPGPVKTETFDVKMDKTDLKITSDSVELRAGTSFLVTYVDAPEEVAKLPAAGRFDKVRDAIKGEKGKVLEDKELMIGLENHPARDVLIEHGDMCIRNRIVIAGARLYQVIIQGSKEVVTSASADRFLASFEVTK
jgi:hypothetical protein